MEDTLKDYFRDCIYLLRERAAEAREVASTGNAAFDDGRCLAYQEVLSMLQNQADAFAIPRAELGLDFDPFGDVSPPPLS